MSLFTKPRHQWIAEVLLLNAFLFLSPLWSIDWLAEFTREFPDDTRGETLSVIGLILAGSIAGNFSITYEKTKLSSLPQRLLAHATKLALQLSIIWNLMLALGTLKPGQYADVFLSVGGLVFLSILLHNLWDILLASDDC